MSSRQSSPARKPADSRRPIQEHEGRAAAGVAIPINPQLGCAPTQLGLKPRGESLAGTAVQVREIKGKQKELKTFTTTGLQE